MGELDAIRVRHWKVGGKGTIYPEQCVCGLAWPCDAASLLAEIERLRKAIQTVLDDDETGAGGWGPDITMAAILKAALEAGDGK